MHESQVPVGKVWISPRVDSNCLALGRQFWRGYGKSWMGLTISLRSSIKSPRCTMHVILFLLRPWSRSYVIRQRNNRTFRQFETERCLRWMVNVKCSPSRSQSISLWRHMTAVTRHKVCESISSIPRFLVQSGRKVSWARRAKMTKMKEAHFGSLNSADFFSDAARESAVFLTSLQSKEPPTLLHACF